MEEILNMKKPANVLILIYLTSLYFCKLFAYMHYGNSNLIIPNVLFVQHRKRKELKACSGKEVGQKTNRQPLLCLHLLCFHSCLMNWTAGLET